MVSTTLKKLLSALLTTLVSTNAVSGTADEVVITATREANLIDIRFTFENLILPPIPTMLNSFQNFNYSATGQTETIAKNETTPCDTTSFPVDIATGEKKFTERDFVDSGEMPLFIERRYSSVDYSPGIIKANWKLNFELRLDIITSTTRCISSNRGIVGPSECNNIAPENITSLEIVDFNSGLKFLPVQNTNGTLFLPRGNDLNYYLFYSNIH